ncbi:MAG TPA: glycosyltransferase family 4 protein [Novosphingobium sp.]|nr:glycosyltransferase family 4 protein [Novosphingobium sp.]
MTACAPAHPEEGPAIDRIVVIHDFASPVGGAGVLALRAAREYRELGMPVTYFSGQCDEDAPDLTGVERVGIQAAGLLQLSPMSAMAQGFRNTRAKEALSDWITRNDTPGTVYHLHNWSQILSPAVFEALRPVEERLVVTCHDFFNICPNGGFAHFGKSEPCPFRPLSASCLLSRCDRRSHVHKAWRVARQVQLNRSARFERSAAIFTFIHDRMRRKFVESGFGAANMLTIPNPVDPWTSDRICAEQNSEFLFVGRIGPDKGADLAIEAAARAKVPITLVGSRDAPLVLSSGLGRITFAGWCDRPSIARIAQSARALVVPSRVVEPFGLVILEAAMSGLPVIVSDRAYLADDVERLGFGRAFDPSDVSALTDLLGLFSRDDRLIESMSLAGHRSAGSLCSTSRDWAGRFVDLFRSRLSWPNHAAEIPREAALSQRMRMD